MFIIKAKNKCDINNVFDNNFCPRVNEKINLAKTVSSSAPIGAELRGKLHLLINLMEHLHIKEDYFDVFRRGTPGLVNLKCIGDRLSDSDIQEYHCGIFLERIYCKFEKPVCLSKIQVTK